MHISNCLECPKTYKEKITSEFGTREVMCCKVTDDIIWDGFKKSVLCDKNFDKAENVLERYKKIMFEREIESTLSEIQEAVNSIASESYFDMRRQKKVSKEWFDSIQKSIIDDFFEELLKNIIKNKDQIVKTGYEKCIEISEINTW